MKNKLDFLKMFGIIPGMTYHAYDYAVNVCNQSFELYEKSKTEEEREINLQIIEIIAKSTFPPIPIENQPSWETIKYKNLQK